ncbi:hypothetical protein [Xanthomonas floridensis]|uniref:Uncharacterized protein n=1 Tax=Xanthomonas floridensis TaxID=1843580 RepID=A0A1A9MDL7_9XANT|nr:hypothetical protein [Xanthomonas floridensis]MEA5123279.1 hypothetical protein [Xanthomonas floridensis]MEA5132754.1 hypothetical protein [Xanthomonas floridensis]OAG67680.1 hypothetical protein A7D17_15945 [Xanthomonas floridensis]
MDKSRIKFDASFEDKAHLRALSALVGALIATHPDKDKVLAAAEQFVETEEAAFAEIARNDPRVHTGDTHFIAQQFATRVRERIAAIIAGRSR